MISGRLGSGPCRLEIVNRGGTGTPLRFPSQAVRGEFTLYRSKPGECSFEVSSIDHPTVRRALDAVRRWEHEAVVWWDGDRSDGARPTPSFLGPIVQPDWGDRSVQFGCTDVSGWLWKWPTAGADAGYAPAAGDLTTVAVNAVNAAVTEWGPGSGIVARARSPHGIVGSSAVQAGSVAYVGDFLDDLGDIGLRWTTVGRVVWVGPSAGDSFKLALSDFAAPPRVIEVGGLEANAVVVAFRDSTTIGFAIDNAAAARQGALFHLENDAEGLPADQAAADAIAAQILVQRRVPIHVNLDGVGHLRPTAPVTLEQLIPGSTGVIGGTTPGGRNFSGRYTITSTTVDFAGKVSIELEAIAA